ncbi:hypothetical protein LOAG_02648 [Loa loa]|uniref:Uncharacterized protein n=1 Tax=Loa loa TaxID=7209 RepID=A0A1S0U700_LOALO|nr:hypothetical protein LOAG_02648 [Loa loa]EFO25835.2 hypothetical protein LOAG_02648 [Loa loa]
MGWTGLRTEAWAQNKKTALRSTANSEWHLSFPHEMLTTARICRSRVLHWYQVKIQRTISTSMTSHK